jgi:hypothetical protein
MKIYVVCDVTSCSLAGLINVSEVSTATIYKVEESP